MVLPLPRPLPVTLIPRDFGAVSALDAINLGSQPQPASAPTFPAQLSPQRPLRVKFPSPRLCPAWMMCSLAMFAVPTSDFFLLYIDIDLVQLLIEAEGLTSTLLPGQYAEDGPKIGG